MTAPAPRWSDGEPCPHPGCLSHVSHPCEGCGRVGGLNLDPRPILVGEANPYGADPRFALYPEPEHSAGGRLCRLVMGLSTRDYLRRFDRRNLWSGKWSMREARETAAAIAREARDRKVVLLGSKVCAAFGVRFEPFSEKVEPLLLGIEVVVLPHPSGLCRLWNEPRSFDRARELLSKAGVL